MRGVLYNTEMILSRAVMAGVIMQYPALSWKSKFITILEVWLAWKGKMVFTF